MSVCAEIKLGDALTFQRGFDITKAEQTPGPVPIVSSSGISSSHNEIKVKGPGVIIGRKGTLGTVHFVKQDYWPHDTTLWVKDFKGNNPQFISYFLRTLKLENFDTGTSNPTLNRNHIHKIKILFPQDLDIQRKISSILTAYDDLIEINKHRITLLEKMAEELYREWFIRMRFPGHQNTRFVKGMPEGWKIEKLTSTNIFRPISPNLENFEGAKNYYATSAVNGTNLSAPTEVISYATKPSRAQFVPKPYSVWFARMKNTYKVLLINDVNSYLCCTATFSSGFAGFEASKDTYPFLYQLIKSRAFHEVKDLYCTGATQESLTNNGLKRISILLPRKEIITDYSGRVTPYLEMAATLKMKNEVLAKTRDFLLPRLISGKLSVDNLDIQFHPSLCEEEKTTEVANA